LMKLSKQNKRKLVAAIVALFVLLAGGVSEKYGLALPGIHDQNTFNQTATAGVYTVKSIEDGDTITVDMNGHDERVRLIGVDTPEVRDPRKPVQCFGRAASAFTKQLIGNHTVRLEADPDNTNRDRYNRLLRYVYLPDGTLLNAEIIKQGYGFAYVNFPVQKMDEFRSLQKEAREQNRGLWAGCEPIPNQYGGFDSNPELTIP